MISQTINRKLMASMLMDSITSVYPFTKQNEDSYLFRVWVLCEPTGQMVDEFIEAFDGETVSEVQQNINYVLTVSKHLLNYDKQDLIWFQKTLARMKHARGAFKN